MKKNRIQLKFEYLIFGFFLLLLIWGFVRFFLGGSEDDWICVDGEWVKHGYPSAPMPIEECGESK
jgi:hypothetical protein